MTMQHFLAILRNYKHLRNQKRKPCKLLFNKGLQKNMLRIQSMIFCGVGHSTAVSILASRLSCHGFDCMSCHNFLEENNTNIAEINKLPVRGKGQRSFELVD